MLGRQDISHLNALSMAMLTCVLAGRRIDYYGFRVYCGRCIRWIRLGAGQFRLKNWIAHCSKIHDRTV